MSASLSLSGGKNVLSTVTVTLAGHAGNTAYNVVISLASGHTETHPVTTNGGGGGSITFVPSVQGTATVNTYLAAPTAAATISTVIGGHG